LKESVSKKPVKNVVDRKGENELKRLINKRKNNIDKIQNLCKIEDTFSVNSFFMSALFYCTFLNPSAHHNFVYANGGPSNGSGTGGTDLLAPPEGAVPRAPGRTTTDPNLLRTKMIDGWRVRLRSALQYRYIDTLPRGTYFVDERGNPTGPMKVLRTEAVDEVIDGLLTDLSDDLSELSERLSDDPFVRAHERLAIASLRDRVRQVELGDAANDPMMKGFLNLRSKIGEAERDGIVERIIMRQLEGGVRGVWMTMGDLDYFKGVNEEYSHFIGDLALTHVAEVITRNIPKSILKIRIGGEEIGFLAEDMDEQDVILAFERAREALVQNPLYLLEEQKLVDGEWVATDSLPVKIDASVYHARLGQAGENARRESGITRGATYVLPDPRPHDRAGNDGTERRIRLSEIPLNMTFGMSPFVFVGSAGDLLTPGRKAALIKRSWGATSVAADRQLNIGKHELGKNCVVANGQKFEPAQTRLTVTRALHSVRPLAPTAPWKPDDGDEGAGS